MKFKRLLLAAVAAVLPITSWNAPAFADKADGTFRFAMAQTIDSPDPYYNNLREAMLLFGNMIFDTLVYYDFATGKYVPLLATEWRWIDDDSIEFKLRQDVKFHDGSEFDADDVVYTLNYVSRPENKILVPENASWIDRAEKNDKFTVTVHLKSVNPVAFEYFSGPLHMLPEGYYGEGGAQPSVGENGGMVGTGPYRITAFTPKVGATFVKNENYFQDGPKGQAGLDRIENRMIPDMTTQIAEMRGGGLDWIWRLDRDTIESLRGQPTIDTSFDESIRLVFMRLDATGRSGVEPLKDKRVRQAIAHAINREAIIPALVGVQPLNTPCYPGQFGCDPAAAISYAYDPEKAKALLAEAGYPDGFDLILSDSDQRSADMALAFAADLAKVGIRTKVESLRFQEQYRRATEGELQADIYSYGSYGIKDTQAILPLFFNSASSSDYTKDAELDGWLSETTRTIDQEKRKELFAKAIERVTGEAYWIPLYANPVGYAYTKEVDFKSYFDENPRLFMVKWK